MCLPPAPAGSNMDVMEGTKNHLKTRNEVILFFSFMHLKNLERDLLSLEPPEQSVPGFLINCGFKPQGTTNMRGCIPSRESVFSHKEKLVLEFNGSVVLEVHNHIMSVDDHTL